MVFRVVRVVSCLGFLPVPVKQHYMLVRYVLKQVAGLSWFKQVMCWSQAANSYCSLGPAHNQLHSYFLHITAPQFVWKWPCGAQPIFGWQLIQINCTNRAISFQSNQTSQVYPPLFTK